MKTAMFIVMITVTCALIFSIADGQPTSITTEYNSSHEIPDEIKLGNGSK